jgi:hypothetical protein
VAETAAALVSAPAWTLRFDLNLAAARRLAALCTPLAAEIAEEMPMVGSASVLLSEVDFVNIRTGNVLQFTMKLPPNTPDSEYAAGYADGRHAAKEHVPANENPYKRGTQCWHGWNDGHYDERSLRFVQIAKQSAFASSESK